MNTRTITMRMLFVGVIGGVAIGLGGAPFEAQGVAFVGAMLVYAALRTLSAHKGRNPLRGFDPGREHRFGQTFPGPYARRQGDPSGRQF